MLYNAAVEGRFLGSSLHVALSSGAAGPDCPGINAPECRCSRAKRHDRVMDCRDPAFFAGSPAPLSGRERRPDAWREMLPHLPFRHRMRRGQRRALRLLLQHDPPEGRTWKQILFFRFSEKGGSWRRDVSQGFPPSPPGVPLMLPRRQIPVLFPCERE